MFCQQMFVTFRCALAFSNFIFFSRSSGRNMDDTASTTSSQSHNRSASLGTSPYLSNSNPDLSTASFATTYDANYPYQSNVPDDVLKIFRADQSCKYFLVHKVNMNPQMTV